MEDNKMQQVRDLIYNRIRDSIGNDLDIEVFVGDIAEWCGWDIRMVATLLIEAEIAWAELALTREHEKRESNE